MPVDKAYLKSTLLYWTLWSRYSMSWALTPFYAKALSEAVYEFLYRQEFFDASATLEDEWQ